MGASLWTRRIAALVLALPLLLAAALARPAQAAELIMFDMQGCPWCRLWHKEIGPAYPHSAEGRRAPLRVVDLKGPTPADVILAAPVRSSPTFVLVDQGREVGRITGYPGADFFWGLLDQLLAKLDAPPQQPGARAVEERSL